MESETTSFTSTVAGQRPHERPKTILAVHIFLRREGRVLVLRRMNTSYMSGRYCLPGGHVEPGETASEASIRETFEECGARIAEENLRFCGVMHRFAAGQPLARVELFFSSDIWEGPVVIAEANRFDDLKWVPVETPPSDIVPFMSAALTASRGITPWYLEFDWADRSSLSHSEEKDELRQTR